MTVYCVPYLILMLALGVMAYFRDRYKDKEEYCKALEYSGLAILIFFIGLRGFAMFDWRNYYPDFQNVSFSDIANYEVGTSTEIGWTIFQLICKSIWDSYHFMAFVQSVVLLALLTAFFKRYSKNILLSYMLFLAFEGFPISFNLMRNSLAIAIFLNALPFLFNRKPIQYFSLCLLAFCFHYSSVLYIPVYFFLHIKLNKYIFLGYLLGCTVVYFLSIPLFATLAEILFGGNEIVAKAVKVYSEMSHETKLSLVFLERFMTGILIFCYYDKLNKMRKETPMFVNAFLIYITCAFLFSDLSEISNRLSTLFIFSYWVLYGDIVRCFAIANNKRLFVSFITLYCLFRTAMPMGNVIYRYDNLIFGIQSFNQRAAIFDRTHFEKD